MDSPSARPSARLPVRPFAAGALVALAVLSFAAGARAGDITAYTALEEDDVKVGDLAMHVLEALENAEPLAQNPMQQS